MKKLFLTPILALLLAGSSVMMAQNPEYLGLPGDNLNLFAVMNLFQESETLEGFERGLNDPEKMINNLDLNGDNYVDYIMVHDYKDGDINTIVLRVALNAREMQDVAVFTVQRLRDGSALVQLIGDEALYGKNYIVEPNYAETPNPGYNPRRPRQKKNVTVVHTTYYEVAHWPIIVYMHQPTYVVWRSSWYWGYYPSYWHPRNPHYWHYYYGYHSHWNPHYYSYYRPYHHHRVNVYHTHYYTNIRTYSPTVIVNVNQGNYNQTYSRPERRRDGEELFNRRHPQGTPARVQNTTPANRAEGRRGESAVQTAGESNRRTRNAQTEGETTRTTREQTTRRQAGEATTAEPTGRRQSGTTNGTTTRSTEVRRSQQEENRAPESATPRSRQERPVQSTEGNPRVASPQIEQPNRQPRENATAPTPETPRRTETTTPAAPQRSNTPAPARTTERSSQPERSTPAPARATERPVDRSAPAPARTTERPAERSAPAPARTTEQARPAPAAPRESAPAPARAAERPVERSAPAPSRPAEQTRPAPARESAPAPARTAEPERKESSAPARTTERNNNTRQEENTSSRTPRKR
jgi:hypothetical protein